MRNLSTPLLGVPAMPLAAEARPGGGGRAPRCANPLGRCDGIPSRSHVTSRRSYATIAELIAALEAAVIANDPSALAVAFNDLAYDIGEDIGRDIATALARAYHERERARPSRPRIVPRCA